LKVADQIFSTLCRRFFFWSFVSVANSLGFFFAFVLFRFEGFVFVLGLKDSSVGFACGGGVSVSEGCEGLHVMLVT
jgi:hypothetical protein